MSRFICFFLPLIFAGLVFAQLDSNSATVTVSRSLTVQPDQALFVVSVMSDLNATLGDVLNAVQPAGLPLANFAGVTTTTVQVQVGRMLQDQPAFLWSFGLTTPLTGIKSTLATLSALQKNAPKALSVSYSLQGTQVSQQLQQSQTCDTAGLVSDARAKAQDLATAGGRTLSGILALSTNTSSTSGTAVSLYPNSFPQPCSATVKFALLGSN